MNIAAVRTDVPHASLGHFLGEGTCARVDGARSAEHLAPRPHGRGRSAFAPHRPGFRRPPSRGATPVPSARAFPHAALKASGRRVPLLEARFEPRVRRCGTLTLFCQCVGEGRTAGWSVPFARSVRVISLELVRLAVVAEVWCRCSHVAAAPPRTHRSATAESLAYRARRQGALPRSAHSDSGASVHTQTTNPTTVPTAARRGRAPPPHPVCSFLPASHPWPPRRARCALVNHYSRGAGRRRLALWPPWRLEAAPSSCLHGLVRGPFCLRAALSPTPTRGARARCLWCAEMMHFRTLRQKDFKSIEITLVARVLSQHPERVGQVASMPAG